MHILAIDTSTSSGGTALFSDGELIGLVMVKKPLQYSETILELVDFLLQKHGKTLAEIDCLGVATGPGSFTGVRIGLATVKGLCHALGKPAIGVSTLEALAYRFRDVHPLVVPLIDARRQQIYGAPYQISAGEIASRGPEQVMAPSDWLKQLPKGEFLFVGDGARLHRPIIEAVRPGARILDTDNQVLEPLCQLTYQRAQRGEGGPVEKLRANYIRPPDIRR